MASPIKSKQGKVTVRGVELDVVRSEFADRVFLMISDCQKLGTLLEVKQAPSVTNPSSHSYSVRTLLGKDEPAVHVFGRAIAAHSSLPPTTPLLLALGMRNPDPAMIPQLLKELENFKLGTE